MLVGKIVSFTCHTPSSWPKAAWYTGRKLPVPSFFLRKESKEFLNIGPLWRHFEELYGNWFLYACLRVLIRCSILKVPWGQWEQECWAACYCTRGPMVQILETHIAHHVHVQMKAIEMMQLQVKEHQNFWATRCREGQGSILLWRLQREYVFAYILIWTSSFHDCDRIKFCSLKPPSLWSFVTTALGN